MHPETVLLANQHVEPLFAYSARQLDHVTNLLLERNAILKDLFPWDDVNYGVDEQWSHVYPYGQKAGPGQTVEISVKVFNHSEVSRTFILEPNIPDGFTVEPKASSLKIKSRKEDRSTFKITIPEKVLPGVYLLTVNVKFDSWDLREWSEALIEISP